MSFNVLYDSTEIEKSLDAIEQNEADVLCLRELSSHFLKAFEKRMAKKYPYRFMRPKQSGTWGAGIASRFKLSNSVVFEQKPHRLPAVESTVTTSQGRFHFACLHLMPPVAKHRKSDGFLESIGENAELRKKQSEFIAARYAALSGPVVIAGDMNESSGEAALETFSKAGFQRSCEAPVQDCGATFPGAASRLPALFEIDHILGRKVKFQTAGVLKAGGSDHYPIYATFELLP